MKLGSIEFHILNDGTFRLDGGAMFGVIPKPMWERVVPCDDRNRITLTMNSLLIRAAAQWILVETGAGDKFDDKRRDIYAFQGAPRLLAQLAARGLEPEQIDIVINTHLHFDHCGWNTRIVNSQAVPTFPNARYFVHRGELEHARHPTERDRVSYIPDNFEPMVKSGQWQLVEGEHREVVPGVELIVLAGHTNDMMGVRLSSGGQTAIFLSDLVPMTCASAACRGSWASTLIRSLRSRTRKSGCRRSSAKAGWRFSVMTAKFPRPGCASKTARSSPSQL